MSDPAPFDPAELDPADAWRRNRERQSRWEHQAARSLQMLQPDNPAPYQPGE